MNLNNTHKALIITALIAATVLLLIFNTYITGKAAFLTETYYELDPKLTPEKEAQLLQEKLANKAAVNAKAETNEAFNSSKKTTRFTQAYKTINPPDSNEKKSISETENHDPQKLYDDSKFITDNSLNQEDINTFNKVNAVLDKQLTEKRTNNSKSTISYTLINRTHKALPVPVYLCETGGIIIIDIIVNSSGHVIDVAFNNNSSTDNECLKERALNYAKAATFNADLSKPTQSGSITFHFIAK